MKKVILKLDLHDDRGKQKALKAVSGLAGVESIAMDMKDKKLTVIGDVDPVNVVAKIRKFFPAADILTVGPAKEEKKKEEPKKDPPKKDDKPKTEKEMWEAMLEAHKRYPPYPPTYHVYSVEENPNSCVIC